VRSTRILLYASRIERASDFATTILTNRFGRSACAWIFAAAAMLPAVSLARSGEISIETQPAITEQSRTESLPLAHSHP
jgi:hypothetical protein